MQEKAALEKVMDERVKGWQVGVILLAYKGTGKLQSTKGCSKGCHIQYIQATHCCKCQLPS
jgi:hypothetical protein